MMRGPVGPITWRFARRAAFYGALLLVLAVFVFPFFWMALNSVKTHEKILEYPPAFVFSPTVANFRNVFQQTPFFQYTWNSVLVSFGSVGVGMLLGLPAAYGITSTATGLWP